MVWRKLGDLYLERVTLAKATKRRNDESDENEHAPIGQLAPSSACPLVCLSARLFVCSLNCDKYDEYDNNDETTKRTCPHKAVSSLIRSSACLLVCLSVCLFVGLSARSLYHSFTQQKKQHPEGCCFFVSMTF